MQREFKYEVISLRDIEHIEDWIFICNGNYKKVILDKEDQKQMNNFDENKRAIEKEGKTNE